MRSSTRRGISAGLSAHYSGSGFSRMNFAFHGLSQQGFDEWVAKAKAARSDPRPRGLSEARKAERSGAGPLFRLRGERPLRRHPRHVRQPGQMCVSEMHHIDGWAAPARKAKRTASGSTTTTAGCESGDEPSGATFPASGRPPRSSVQPEGMMPRDQAWAAAASTSARPSRTQGQGNALPGAEEGPRRRS